MQLFVYGELCKPAVLVEVLGRIPAAEPAILTGYRRELNEETGYYRAARSRAALMPGLLLEEIADDELRTLDNYENVAGGEYARVEVEVRPLGSSESVTAQAYAAVE